MRDEDRLEPEADEDKATFVRDEDGRARLLPGGNVVEGEIDEEAPPAFPPSP